MNILTFLSGLTGKLGVIGKNEVAKTCELNLRMLRDNTIPAYVSAEEYFSKQKPKSSDVTAIVSLYKRGVRGGAPDFFEGVLEGMRSAESWLVGLEKKSETLFADQEATLALSYEKATYLRIAASIGFATEYARRLLNHIYILETIERDDSQRLEDYQTPAEINYLSAHQSDFFLVLTALLVKFSKVEEMLADMPDATVTELTEKTFPHTLGAKKVDPLGFNGFVMPYDLSVKWNPFYLLGTCIASFQVSQFKAAEAELELLRLRKLNLERLNEKKPDAKLQAMIAKLEERVGTLRYEISKMEASYGI